MTRRAADTIDPAVAPVGFDIYAGYDDGHWPDADALAARFPGATTIRITVFPSDDKGDCLDVESRDATPGQAPAWVAQRRQDGHKGPLVYCSESIWGDVRAAFQAAQVPEPGYWVAGYPGAEGDAIPPGAVGHQWIDRGDYDESVFIDYLPGIDPNPVPPTPVPPTPPPEAAMKGISPSITLQNHEERRVAIFLNFLCHWHRDPATGQWTGDNVALVNDPNGTNGVRDLAWDPEQVPTLQVIGRQIVIGAATAAGGFYVFRQNSGERTWGVEKVL